MGLTYLHATRLLEQAKLVGVSHAQQHLGSIISESQAAANHQRCILAPNAIPAGRNRALSA